MNDPSSGLTDQQFENLLAYLLRSGVAVAAAIVLLGAIPYLARHAGQRMDRQTFEGEPSNLRTLGGILADVRQFHGRGIIQLGLLALIATPVMRVALSIWGFARQRDWVYVLITSAVLLILLFSLGDGYLRS